MVGAFSGAADMRLTSFLAFILSFLATLAACQWSMPERDVASYEWRGDVREMSRSARQ